MSTSRDAVMSATSDGIFAGETAEAHLEELVRAE